MQKEKHYYPALTGIRAIATWMVFIHHDNPFSEQIFGKRIHLFFAEMHIGLPIFFSLSGLLFTLRYYDRAIMDGRGFYNYMVKRFARIYPVFFLVISVNFIWLLAQGKFDHLFSAGWAYYLATLTLLHGFSGEISNLIVPQSWSLTVEECFYFLCPFIFFFIRRKAYFIALLPVIFILSGLAIASFFMAHPFHGFMKDIQFMFNYTFFGRCIEFFAGIGIALIYKKLKIPSGKGIRFTITGIFVIILCLLGLSFLHTGSFYGDHYPLGIIINNVLLPVFGIAPLFLGLLTEKNIFSRFLSTAVMVQLGKSTYIFYLIHVGIVSSFIVRYVSEKPVILFILLNLIALALYHLYEHPMNKLIRRKLLRKEKDAVVTS